ncbi:hypothetical protein O3P69_004045 [Scylla paramamosain]
MKEWPGSLSPSADKPACARQQPPPRPTPQHISSRAPHGMLGAAIRFWQTSPPPTHHERRPYRRVRVQPLMGEGSSERLLVSVKGPRSLCGCQETTVRQNKKMVPLLSEDV